MGEYAPAGVLSQPLILMGSVSPLHVRIDVDENDAWRVRPGANAVGFLRGNKDIHTALEFVRYEPFVVPKKSLTGESTERVDTRVFQVLYRFDPDGLPIFVGQQMDVYIDASSVDERRSRITAGHGGRRPRSAGEMTVDANGRQAPELRQTWKRGRWRGK